MSVNTNKIDKLNGVQYVTEHADKIRVVFAYRATFTDIQRVEQQFESRGVLSATQEHMACMEYDKQ
jgi:uncharacterized protein YcbK (DUF882 family)